MTKQYFFDNSFFTYKNGLFCQVGIDHSSFEKSYLTLREKENRVYSDEIVSHLPEISDELKKEWPIRKISMQMLIRYLKKKNSDESILELGCGNGWLVHNLVTSLDIEAYGIDINEMELLQASRVFNSDKKLSLLLADIYTANFDSIRFGNIILAGSIQYFSDLARLINRLLELLLPSGEIHILDSPFYNTSSQLESAKMRTREYFESLGLPDMTGNYFHHSVNELKNFNCEILYNPKSFSSLFERKIVRKVRPVFPWIRIRHNQPRF